VQRPRQNFNVTGRLVEMGAQKFYTDAKFGSCGKVPGHDANGRLGIQRLSATNTTVWRSMLSLACKSH